MRYRLLVWLCLICLAGAGLTSTTQAQENDPMDEPTRDSVAVNIYNQGTALVQDVRTFTFDDGLNRINFADVASQIDATSVSFTSLTDPDGTTVLEQNYVYDLVDISALLERYLDETIEITTREGTLFQGELLSGQGSDIIIRTNEGTVQAVRREHVQNIQFPELPDGLITRPTLRWLVNSSQSGEQQVELTYLTGGLNWTADYNLLLATDNNSLDLNGWVTLNNTSGTAYENATVKLVAGDVNRLPDEQAQAEMMRFDEAEAMPQAAGQVEQREFFEYQLYEIARNVTIGRNEQKQVEFVTGNDVSANTFYVYDGSPRFFGYGGFNNSPGYSQRGVTDVQNYLEFSTDEESGLGADLPAGRVRVYQEDVDGAALLIGENRIDHTPEGETVELFLGNAFDLVGERTQTDFDQLGSDVVEESFEIRLRNRKDDETVTIRVPERLSRSQNWEILNASHEYEKTSAFAIEFRVDVAPGEEEVITYTVRYTRQR